MPSVVCPVCHKRWVPWDMSNPDGTHVKCMYPPEAQDAWLERRLADPRLTLKAQAAELGIKQAHLQAGIEMAMRRRGLLTGRGS